MPSSVLGLNNAPIFWCFGVVLSNKMLKLTRVHFLGTATSI